MRSNIKMGARLKQCREQVDGGKTQEVAASELGISREYLAALETNRKQPSYDLLLKIASHYKTSTDWILGHTRQQKPLPEDAQKLINYINSMSNRGREQLLKIATVLYEEDREFQRQEDWRNGLRSILGEETFTAMEAEVFSALADPTQKDGAVGRISKTFKKDVSGDSGQ